MVGVFESTLLTAKTQRKKSTRILFVLFLGVFLYAVFDSLWIFRNHSDVILSSFHSEL
jgi:hypothetical protein